MRRVINIISILNSRKIYIQPLDSDTVSRFIMKKQQGINTMDIFPGSPGKISTLKNYAFEFRMSHFCKTPQSFCGKLKPADHKSVSYQVLKCTSDRSFILAPCKALAVGVVLLALSGHFRNDLIVLLIAGSINSSP